MAALHGQNGLVRDEAANVAAVGGFGCCGHVRGSPLERDFAPLAFVLGLRNGPRLNNHLVSAPLTSPILATVGNALISLRGYFACRLAGKEGHTLLTSHGRLLLA